VRTGDGSGKLMGGGRGACSTRGADAPCSLGDEGSIFIGFCGMSSLEAWSILSAG
jgi:hypothetical protein